MLFKFIEDTLHHFNVTNYQPVGWDFNKVHERFRTSVVKKPQESHSEQASPVFFVHGIFHNASALYLLEKKCKRHGFQNVHTLKLWKSLQSLHHMAQQLHEEVEQVFLNHRQHKTNGKIRLVGHSLGGMVVRTALLNEEFASMIDKTIFLSTPHQGSKLYELPFPPCLKDLGQDSSLLKRLKTEPLPGGIEYWNLRGRLDVVVPGKRTLLPGVPNLIFDDIGHAGLLSNPKVANCLITLLEDISDEDKNPQPSLKSTLEGSAGA